MEPKKKVEFTGRELAYLLDVIEQEKEECEAMYWSDEEKKLGDEIINDVVGGSDFGALLVSNRFESQGGRYDEETNKKIITKL